MKAPRWPSVLNTLIRYAPSALALLLLGLVYFLGIRSERTGFVEQVLAPGLKRITAPVLNAFRATPPKIPQLSITLSPELLDSLSRLEEQAIERGWLDTGIAPWLSGRIAVNSDTQIVRLRPLEGPVNHLPSGQWSYTLALERNDSLLHGRLLEVLPVQDGGPVYALLLEAVLRELGIPQTVRSMADIAIGTRPSRLYTVTPLPDSTLLVDRGLSTGPMYSFDDVLRKHARKSISGFVHPVDAPARMEWLSAPLVRTPLRGIPSPGEAEAARKAMLSLEAFRSGQASASDVFDVERTAKLMAACDVFGAQATLRWWNLRFLPDTDSGKLVIIPMHLIAGEAITSLGVQRTGTPIAFPSSAGSFAGRILGDLTLYKRYMAWLDSLSSPGWADTLIARKHELIDRADRVVRGEFPEHRFDTSILPHNIRTVRLMLTPDLPLLAYIRPAQHGYSQLALANVHDLPVEVVGYVTGNDTVRLSRPMLLPPREPERPLQYSRIIVPDHATRSAPQVMVHLPGTRYTVLVNSKRALVHEATP